MAGDRCLEGRVVAVGRAQGENRAVGAAPGGLDDERAARLVLGVLAVEDVQFRAALGLQGLGHAHTDTVRNLAQGLGEADLGVGGVQSVEEVLGGAGRQGLVTRHEVGMVLVQQLDENGPGPGVLEGAVGSLVVGVVQPVRLQLVVDAVHEVDVGVVVQLQGGSHVEVIPALFRGQARQIPAHLRLARSRQAEEEKRIEELAHGIHRANPQACHALALRESRKQRHSQRMRKKRRLRRYAVGRPMSPHLGHLCTLRERGLSFQDTSNDA